MNLERIKDSTPVREFPVIYNGNIDELVEEINDLNDIINEKDLEIKKLKKEFYELRADLTANFLKQFKEKITEIENEITAINSKLND